MTNGYNHYFIMNFEHLNAFFNCCHRKSRHRGETCLKSYAFVSA